MSLLLATQSLRFAWTPEGYGAWARGVALLPRRPTTWIGTDGSGTVNLAFHPTRPWLALVGEDGIVRIRDISSGSAIKDLRLEEVPQRTTSTPGATGYWLGAAVRFSPDGSTAPAAFWRLQATPSRFASY